MAKVKREDLEGSISVTDDVTPITRRPVEQVDAADWMDLSVAELSSQLATLQQRLGYARMHSPTMVKPLMLGVKQLELVIKSKQKDDTGLI